MSTWWGNEDLFKLNYELEDLDIVGDHLFSIGVPWSSNEEFRKRVLAGGKSYNFGIKSIDYLLKKYGEEWNIGNNEQTELLNHAIQDLKMIIRTALDYLMHIPNKPDFPSLFFCGAALIRLQNTFKSALLCIKSDLNFECMAMSRMILEQLAWIFRIHKEEFDKNIQPNKCIKDLKKLIPFAGRLYNHLSEGVHISPKLMNQYIDKNLSIKMGDIKQSYKNMYLLLKLADIFCIVGEYIYANFNLIEEYKFVEYIEGEFKPRECRGTIKILKKYEILIKDQNELT